MKKWLLRVLDVVLVATGVWVVWRIVRDYPLPVLEHAIFSIPWWALAASLVLTAVGYVALVGYDFLALKLVKHPLSLERVLAPSFISFAVANNAPVAVLTGGGLRYRLYRGLGLPAKKMAKVAAFDVLTFVLGLFTIAGLAFEVAPLRVPRGWHVPLVDNVRPVGIVLLVAVAVFLVLNARHRRLCIFDHEVTLPGLRMALAEIGVSGFDWILSSGALFVLLRSVAPIGYAVFLAGFLLAQIATQVIPLPGGIGAFEAIVLLLRPAHTPAPAIFAGLVAYRVIYYFLPLALAGILLLTTQRRLLTKPEKADKSKAA